MYGLSSTVHMPTLAEEGKYTTGCIEKYYVSRLQDWPEPEPQRKKRRRDQETRRIETMSSAPRIVGIHVLPPSMMSKLCGLRRFALHREIQDQVDAKLLCAARRLCSSECLTQQFQFGAKNLLDPRSPAFNDVQMTRVVEVGAA